MFLSKMISWIMPILFDSVTIEVIFASYFYNSFMAAEQIFQREENVTKMSSEVL